MSCFGLALVFPLLGQLFEECFEVLFGGGWEGVLLLAEGFVVEFGFDLGFFGGDGAGVVEDGAVADLEELVELGAPVLHVHRLAVEGA